MAKCALKYHSMINNIEHKLCYTCRQWKPLDQFSSNIHSWDKKQYDCRDCVKSRHNRIQSPDPEPIILNEKKERYIKTKKKKVSIEFYNSGMDKLDINELLDKLDNGLLIYNGEFWPNAKDI